MFCSRYPSSAARPLLLTLLCGVLLFLLPACEGTKRLPDAPVRYQIVPQENNNADIDVVNYLKKHLQKRSASYNILSEEAGNGVRRVTLHLDPALDGDYQVHHEGENVALTTKDMKNTISRLPKKISPFFSVFSSVAFPFRNCFLTIVPGFFPLVSFAGISYIPLSRWTNGLFLSSLSIRR